MGTDGRNSNSVEGGNPAPSRNTHLPRSINLSTTSLAAKPCKTMGRQQQSKPWFFTTGLGRLEKHRGVAVGVEVRGCFASHFDIVTTLQVDLSRVQDLWANGLAERNLSGSLGQRGTYSCGDLEVLGITSQCSSVCRIASGPIRIALGVQGSIVEGQAPGLLSYVGTISISVYVYINMCIYIYTTNITVSTEYW